MKAMVRFAIPLIVMLAGLVLVALSAGYDLPGDHVAAFTTNTYRTRSMYVFDMAHSINLYIEFTGHDDELPVWSPSARTVIFYPRDKDASNQQP